MPFLRPLLAAALAACALLPAARAQDSYPSRPVTFITAFAPGNGPDVLVRAMAQAMARDSGASFVVDSKPGAGTFLAAQPVARATPDGYTILVTGGSTFTSARYLFKKLPYDPVKDFQPVTMLARGPLVLLVNANLPVKSVPELIAMAKREPGRLTYGDASAGTRVAGELFQRAAGIQLTRVPYKSSTQALPDLASGQIHMIFTDMTAMRLVHDGRIRALAITDAKRTTLAPELPTMKEVGVAGMESVGFTVMMAAPAGTPPRVVEKLRTLVNKASRAPEVMPVYAANGMYSFLTTPADMRNFIESEAAMWRDIAKAAGIEPQ